MENSEPPTSDQPELGGREVDDEKGNKIGHVVDVIYDEKTFEARMVVVHPGPLHPNHFVPLDRSYVSEEGRLVVDYEKDAVLHSPKAPKDHVLTSSLEEEVLRHYGAVAE
jgi:sporulation protein YlmC with PRC-barrel domain